jgi:glycosyltransferase involved in cell wall biosynthesis
MTPRIFNELEIKSFEVIRMNDSFGLDVARNELIKEFLKTDCEWLFFMDDDVVCCKNIMDIFSIKDAQIVAPYSNSFHDDPVISVYQWTNDDRDRLMNMPHETMLEVFEKCKAAGVRPIYPIADMVGNCYAVRRDVFDKVVDEDGDWFKLNWRTPSGEIRRGEDTYFFRRCNERGIYTHVAFDVRVGHHKTIDLAQLYDANHGIGPKRDEEKK